MDISQANLKTLPRALRFTGVLEVVDCIDYNKPRTVFSIGNLRDTFLSIFPDKVFKEESFRFFTDMNGTRVIMQIHDLSILHDYIESMDHMRYLGIRWDKIHDEMKKAHASS
ncbi:MAG: hypothetical protein JEZ05_04050 [Tenericutes bacterium]|nr:hypothetical protein [Mycoplasmatota bacterium]